MKYILVDLALDLFVGSNDIFLQFHELLSNPFHAGLEVEQ
jgi:hypothetical protein